MKNILIPVVVTLLGASSSLLAQEPRVGIALNLVLPTGTFQNLKGSSLDNQGIPYSYSSGYDLGVGGQVTFSFPVAQKLAFRMNVSGQSTNGSDTAPGYSKINLRHVMYGLGGDLQIFTQSAYRHRGLYFLAGLSADFERFDRSEGDIDSDWSPIDSTRKARLGGNIGIGHTFGYDAGTRFTLEASFHKSLTGNDIAKGDPPSTEFARISFGWIF